MKYFVFFFSITCSISLFAQTTITLQPGASGKDCEVWSLSPSTNYVSDLLRGNAWTWGNSGIERGFFQFDLSSISANATILSAYLSLFAPDSPSTEFDYPASGSNQCWLQRVTSDWSEDSITWDNQPSTTTLHQVFLPQSVVFYQDYPNIDVTTLVQDLVSDPMNSFGFMIKLDTESYYRRLTFCSSDYPNSSKHPKLEVTYSLGVTICEKFCLDFSDPSLNNPTSWLWIFDGGNPGTSTQQNPADICYSSPGVYDVTLITSNANGSDTLLLPGYVTVNPTPAFPTITQNGYTLISSIADSYQWQFNSVDIPGATNQSYSVLQTGYYTVVISDSNGCVNSWTVYVQITGIGDITNLNSLISIYPNPATDYFVLKSAGYNSTENYTVRMVDLNGRVVIQKEVSGKKLSEGFDISSFPAAPYFVFISSNTSRSQMMIVKQ